MKKVAVILALAGIAAVASARPNQIDVKVRVEGDATWSDAINVVPGAKVEVGVFYNWEDSTAIAFSTSVHNLRLFGSLATDTAELQDRGDSTQHPDGRQGRFNFGGQKQALYGASDWRVSASGNNGDNSAGGISIKQNTPAASGALLDRSNPAYGYLFKFTVDANDPGAGRVITADAPKNKINSYKAYNAEGGTSVVDLIGSLLDTDTATVTVLIPAPGAFALVGMGGLAIARRRR